MRKGLNRIAMPAIVSSLGLLASVHMTPPQKSLTYADILVAEINTPEEAENYVRAHFPYADEDITPEGALARAALDDMLEGKTQTLEASLVRGRGVCRDGAMLIAAVLQDNGYTPYLLTMQYWQGTTLINHAVFAFKENGLWGSVGIHRSDYQQAHYTTIQNLSKILVYDGSFDRSFRGCELYSFEGIDLLKGNGKGRLPSHLNTRLVEGYYTDEYITNPYAVALKK